MANKKLNINDYLRFKEECVEEGIFDINEIIKLFEVWLKSLT